MKYCKIRLLEFTTARLITNYANVYYNLRLLGYYNSRQLLLQFTTDITIIFTTFVITIYDRYFNSRQNT